MTRSVHPLALALLNDLLAALKQKERVVNPFALFTKGEVCRRNLELGVDTLRSLAATISCSHPDPRNGGDVSNCGYCYPCLIRHASLAAAGGDETCYRDENPAEHRRFRDSRRGALSAVQDWLKQDFTSRDLIAAGPLPPGSDLRVLTEVVQRSREELAAAFR